MKTREDELEAIIERLKLELKRVVPAPELATYYAVADLVYEARDMAQELTRERRRQCARSDRTKGRLR